MTNDQIDYQVFKIHKDISDNALRSAIDGLREFAFYVGASNAAQEVDALEQRYFYMLRFLADGVDIPEMQKERRNIEDACRLICDKIEIEAHAQLGDKLYYTRVRFNRMRPEENLESIISDYLSELSHVQTDSTALTDNRAFSKLETIAADIFERLWTTYPLSEEEEHLLSTILTDNELPPHDREMWVGALGLGQIERPDNARRRLLEEVLNNSSTRMSAAAAIWLFADAQRDSSGDRLRRFKEENPEDFFDISYEFARARGTEKLSEDVRLNVMPRMFDMGREVAEKLKNADNDIDDILRNSDWTPNAIDAEGFEKLKGFVDAQAEGDDVYMATLGQPSLRQFPFFHKLNSWFLPFHTGSSEIADVTDGEGAAFADTLDHFGHICDNDKYAIALAMANTPSNLSDKAFQAMAGNYEAMSSEEVRKTMEENNLKGRRGAINNYIKNLYRFYHLYRRKNEFPEIFTLNGGLTIVTPDMVSETDTPNVERLAERLMKNKNYDTAASLYDIIISYNPENLGATQKSGFCHEMGGLDHIAAERYTAALELRPDDLWSAMRLADINLRSGDAPEAIEILQPFHESQSDNPGYLRMLAQSYYYARRYHEASEAYYNLDFILSDNDTSAKGPLAWSLTLEGDFASAEAVYSSFIAESKEPEILLNYAKLLWAQDRRMESLASFRKYIDMVGKDALKALRDNINYHARIELPQLMGHDRYAALMTIPDLLEYRIYGSRNGQL